MEENQPLQQINLRALYDKLIARRKVFYWVLPITFVVSALLILCVPRYYTVQTKMAPELQSSSALGSLGSFASSFGLDLNSLDSEDAIYPTLYPDVINSRDFLLQLFDEEVQTADGEFKGTFYTYLQQVKYPFWEVIARTVKGWLRFSKESRSPGGNPNGNGNEVDPFWLNKLQTNAITLMQENIKCTVDRKTYVITISVTTQDKLVSAMMANIVSEHLQDFITEYRTKKLAKDLEYYEAMETMAKQTYDQARQAYIEYVDSHHSLQLQRYQVQANFLQSDMQMKYASYENFSKQKMITQSKLQEHTPIYTIIESPTVPVKPTGPKRVRFVLAMCFLALIVTALWVTRQEILKGMGYM